MKDILIRFLVGGLVVSGFAAIADILKPKRFAGLFGAAPSIALATLGLTISKDGAMYAATEARSMLAGAVAFFIYASLVSRLMMHHQLKALAVTAVGLLLWAGIALGLWRFWLR